MKKLLLSASSAVAASQLFVMRAFAQLSEPPPIGGLATETDVNGAIIKVITSILDFILIVAVLFVIIAGVRLIVSGGADEQKDKAKNTIIYVVAGIIVVLFARVIVTFVNSAFS